MPQLKLPMNTLQNKSAEASTTASLCHTVSSTASSAFGITPIVSTGETSKTQTLPSSEITFGASTTCLPSNTSNPTTLSSYTLSSQSLQTPITSPALQVQYGQKSATTEKPLVTATVSTYLQVTPKPSSQGLPSNVSLTGTTIPASNLISSGLTAASSTQAKTSSVTNTTSQPTGGLGTNLPQLGSSNIANSLQMGPMVSNLLESGSNKFTGSSNAQKQLVLDTRSKPTGSSLFSGLRGSISAGVPLGTTATTSVGPSSSSSTFTFGAKTTNSNASQLVPKALTFGAPQTPTTYVFGSASSAALSTLPKPSKTSFGSSLTSQGGLSGSTISQFSSTQQTAKENKAGFSFVTQTGPQTAATTSALTVFGAVTSATQSPFGVAAAQKTLGSTTAQSTFGAATTTPSTFGANTSQSTFGAAQSQNSFGLTSTQNPFGSANQVGFGTSSNQNTFRTGSNQNAFPSPAAASSQNIFSSGNAANPPKPAFGSSTSQSPFGKPGKT